MNKEKKTVTVTNPKLCPCGLPIYREAKVGDTLEVYSSLIKMGDIRCKVCNKVQKGILAVDTVDGQPVPICCINLDVPQAVLDQISNASNDKEGSVSVVAIGMDGKRLDVDSIDTAWKSFVEAHGHTDMDPMHKAAFFAGHMKCMASISALVREKVPGAAMAAVFDAWNLELSQFADTLLSQEQPDEPEGEDARSFGM